MCEFQVLPVYSEGFQVVHNVSNMTDILVY